MLWILLDGVWESKFNHGVAVFCLIFVVYPRAISMSLFSTFLAVLRFSEPLNK